MTWNVSIPVVHQLKELKYEEKRHTDSVIPHEYTEWSNKQTKVRINPDKNDSIKVCY